MLRRAVLTALAAAAVCAPAAHAAGAPTMPLGDVRAGMVCEARTVIQGTEVVSFDARVDVVMNDTSDIRRSRILITVSGAAVDKTGVGAGFSGSPVICPGADGVPRIAGAISETIGQYGGTRVLATPIQAVLGEPADPPRQRATAASATALLSGARPIATPITVGGLSTRVGAALQRAARRAGRTLLLSPSARAAQSPGPAVPPVPGGAIAIGYARGDISAGAVGTVSYVDGTAVWAFGHPYDGAGRRDLFLESAFVFGVIDNPLSTDEAATYKLSAPQQTIGALRQDGNSGVVGRLGAPPPSHELRVTARDKDTGRAQALRVQLADERSIGFPVGYSALALLAAPATIQALDEVLSGSPVRQSADMCMKVGVKGRKKPLTLCNRYVGGGGDPEALIQGQMAVDIYGVTGLLDAYDATKLEVTGTQIGLRVRRGLALGTLLRVSGPRLLTRGTTATFRASIRKPGGAVVVRRIRVPVPRLMAPGPRDVFLKGTDVDAAAGGDDIGFDLSGLFGGEGGEEPPPPGSVTELAEAISDLHRYDGVRARLLPPGAGEPEALPGGTERFAQRARRVFRDPKIRIDGRARFRVFVR